MPLENPRGQLLRSHAARDLKEPTLISFVDMARWMAALMVMVGHLRNPLFLGFGELTAAQKPIWVKAWFFITGYHAEAVLVFFVLSGYLVGGLSAARAAEGRWDLKSYGIDRFSRLFVAYVPALILTSALDWTGSHFFGGSGLYNGTHPMIVEKIHGQAFQNGLGPGVFFGNLFMLQYYFVPELGSNDPLWTLSTEWWFYVVFGVVLTALTASRAWIKGVCLVVALLLLALLRMEFIGLLGLWLIGFMISQLPRPPLSHPLVAFIALAGWLVFLRLEDAFFDAHLGWKLASQYVMAAIFAWLILSMRDRRITWLRVLAPFNQFMANFSYSVYLIHFPVLIFTVAMLGSVTKIEGFRKAFSPTDLLGVGVYVGMILLILIVAWLFAQLTERRTGVLRQALRRWIMPQAAA